MINLAPILEIARILAARGHQIEYGTLQGGAKCANGYDFISRFHTLGPPLLMPKYDSIRKLTWDTRNPFKPLMMIKQWMSSSWPVVYASLCDLVRNSDTRPDFILADFLVDAVHDVSDEYSIPIATHWSQMPTMMLPATYVPGQAGMQREVLTSEHATMWQRIQEELVLMRGLPHIVRYFLWFRDVRRHSGVKKPMPLRGNKPDHLVLVNSYFGLEAAKDLPPLVAAIGPVLSDAYPPVDAVTRDFLDLHDRVLYHAMGTVLLPSPILLEKTFDGFLQALDTGVLNGIIWVVERSIRERLTDAEEPLWKDDRRTLVDILKGNHPQILVLDRAEQRAVLDHPHTVCFLTHAGASSANELTYHGVPAITLATMTDQTQNALRLRDAGVSIPLASDTFDAQDLALSIKTIVEDADGSFAQNVCRMRQIARICSRRKHVAADLIEEVICDHEGRFRDGKELRPMHRQTADVRMPWYKARNWDLWAVVTMTGAFGMAVVAMGVYTSAKYLSLVI